MRRHLRNDHSESGERSDMTPFQANKPTNVPMVCPATGCKMTCKQIRWWIDHMGKAHPQCTIVESDNVTENIVAKPQSTELSGNTQRQQEDEAKLQCPLCPRTYTLIKSVQNHCSTTDGRTPRTARLVKKGLDALWPEVPLTRMEGPHIAAPPTPPSGSHPS